MQNDSGWTKQYYSGEAQARVDARRTLWSPELQERVTREWTALFADIRGALGEDPAGPRARALAARWQTLVHDFTGGDAEVQRGLNAMYADQGNWPAEQPESYRIDPEIMDFIERAMQSGARDSGSAEA